jgi:hypothetical protein
MIVLFDNQPLPPGADPYRIPTLFEADQRSFVVGVFSVLADYRDWSFAGYIYQVCDLPGKGFQRVWSRKLYFGRTTITLPTLEPSYLEYDPPYWVEDWTFELWGVIPPPPLIDGGTY